MKNIAIKYAKETLGWTIVADLLMLGLMLFGGIHHSLGEILEVLFETTIFIVAMGLGIMLIQMILYGFFHPMDEVVTAVYKKLDLDPSKLYQEEPEMTKKVKTKKVVDKKVSNMCIALGSGVGLIITILIKVILSNMII